MVGRIFPLSQFSSSSLVNGENSHRKCFSRCPLGFWFLIFPVSVFYSIFSNGTCTALYVTLHKFLQILQLRVRFGHWFSQYRKNPTEKNDKHQEEKTRVVVLRPSFIASRNFLGFICPCVPGLVEPLESVQYRISVVSLECNDRTTAPEFSYLSWEMNGPWRKIRENEKGEFGLRAPVAHVLSVEISFRSIP